VAGDDATIGADLPTEDTVAVTLHRCSNEWVEIDAPPCRNQKALDEQGTGYELVKGPSRRGKG
jgi:hypothetical protein